MRTAEEIARQNFTKHGEKSNGKVSPEYRAWQNMKERCKPSHKDATRYAGKGVSVCDRWANSFETFLHDMGRKPSSLYTLERIDNSKGYEPTNCKWATRADQSRNRDFNKKYIINGVAKTLPEWARVFGYACATFRDRIKHGWCTDCALKTPANGPQCPHKSKVSA